MEVESRTLSEYLVAIKYRMKLVLGVGAAVLAAAIALALLLPPVYQATATILIEQQEIPTELVRSTITTYADQHVQIINRRVMTTTNLAPLIRKYKLYPDLIAVGDLEGAAELMRSTDTQMALVSTSVTDPKTGKPAQTAIAFTVSYAADTPTVAQQVTNDVAGLYLAENVRSRTAQTAEISGFLSAEADRLKQEVAGFEGRLAEFKAKNVGKLPELATLNVQTLDRVAVELSETERQLRTVEAQRISLQAQAAQLEASESPVINARVMTPSQRLLQAQTEYFALAAKYAPDHPDVVRARKELESLKAASGGGTSADISQIEGQLSAKRSELAAAQQRYAPEHPDVRRLSGEVAALEAQLAATRAAPSSSNLGLEAVHESPAYIQVQSGINAADADLRSLRAKQAELAGKRNEYESRLSQAPEVEREYRELSRDYDAATTKLKDVQAKQLEAQLAQNLEAKQKGERFELIEPALLPEVPVRPNRAAIVFLGLVFAFAAGIGAMVVVEALDDTVRGSRGVSKLLNAPPLAVIPVIARRGKQRGAAKATKAAGSIIVGAWALGLLAHAGRFFGLH